MSVIDVNLNHEWKLDFEIDDNLRLTYNDNNSRSEQNLWMDIEGGCESLKQEANLFKEILDFVIPPVKHFLIEHDHEPSLFSQVSMLYVVLLEPILSLQKKICFLIEQLQTSDVASTTDLELPKLFQVDPDKEFDSYQQSLYFSQIQKLLKK